MSFTLHDTIVAISTPQGRAGLGVVRLSGEAAVRIADSLFHPTGSTPFSQAPSHTLLHGWIKDNATLVDEVMACALRKPRTYTGEDVVEISGHGGPVTLQRIVRLCVSRGARLAEPGEFTFRAFINNRMDLSSAEAVADLIHSRTERAAEISLSQLTGTLAVRIQAWRKELIDLLSCLEVALDYAEEDIHFQTPEQIAGRLRAMDEAMQRLQESADKGRFLRDGARLVIIGKPNAGKSSLLNALLERERAIVTDIPGTTRDVIEETLDCRGIPLVVLDTAGLREGTVDPVERIGQERTLESLRAADLILWLLDASAPLEEADRHIAGLLHPLKKGQSLIAVANKTDRGAALNENDIAALTGPDVPLVRISALTRDGLPALEDAIVAAVGSVPAAGEPLLVNVRHQEALRRSRLALGEAMKAQDEGQTEEIIAFHLRETLNILGEITGETTTEDILKNIFSNFCVGK